MSIFGPTDAVDLRCWQARNLETVFALVKLGEKGKLSPLEWNVPTIGTVTGKVRYDADDPRAVFDTWCEALATHPYIEEFGLGVHGELGAVREIRQSDGGVRLFAGWTHAAPRQTRTRLCLLAEWFDDEGHNSDTTTDGR